MIETTSMDRVKQWILSRQPEVADIDLDADLINTRLVDSLGFTEFLLFLEDLAGREIVPSRETVVNLRTLRGIRDHVLQSS